MRVALLQSMTEQRAQGERNSTAVSNTLAQKSKSTQINTRLYLWDERQALATWPYGSASHPAFPLGCCFRESDWTDKVKFRKKIRSDTCPAPKSCMQCFSIHSSCVLNCTWAMSRAFLLLCHKNIWWEFKISEVTTFFTGCLTSQCPPNRAELNLWPRVMLV